MKINHLFFANNFTDKRPDFDQSYQTRWSPDDDGMNLIQNQRSTNPIEYRKIYLPVPYKSALPLRK